MSTDRKLAGLSAIAVIALAGCGSSTNGSATSPGESTTAAGPVAPTAGQPVAWGRLRLPSGATMPYPTSWHRIKGDKGTVSAALFNADGTIRAYLNVTPAIPQETVNGWAHFRIDHNAAEGDRQVKLLSRHTNVPVGGARASCVDDQYTTSRTAYRELACLVAAPRASGRVVIVGAAQPAAWPAEQHVLQYAIDHFTS